MIIHLLRLLSLSMVCLFTLNQAQLRNTFPANSKVLVKTIDNKTSHTVLARNRSITIRPGKNNYDKLEVGKGGLDFAATNAGVSLILNVQHNNNVDITLERYKIFGTSKEVLAKKTFDARSLVPGSEINLTVILDGPYLEKSTFIRN